MTRIVRTLGSRAASVDRVENVDGNEMAINVDGLAVEEVSRWGILAEVGRG